MKIEILKESLKSGLLIIERVIGRNISLPILQNVLLEVEDSFLKLTSTDLETTINVWILAKIIKKGRVVVPAKFLSSFISSIPTQKLIIEAKEQNLSIDSEKTKTQIQGYNPEDFPIIPKIKDAQLLQVNGKRFFQGLSQVMDVASSSQTRPEISGIYFSFLKSNLKMAATDSFRLAEKSMELEKSIKKDHSFILSQRTAKDIVAILENKEEGLILYTSQNQVLFESLMKETEHPSIQITSRLIDGEYPNYQDIIPNKFKTNVVVKKDEFLSQIKTAALFSGKINEVKLLINQEQKTIEIFAKSSDIGESRATIPAKVEGEEVQVSFNYKFLIDGLLNIKSSEVMFDISKEDGPCVLRPVGDASYLYVVMPIKSI